MKKTIIILMLAVSVLIVGCSAEKNEKNVNTPKQQKEQTFTVTQEEKAGVEAAARAMAKKAGEESPKEIAIKADTDEASREPIYLVTVKGTFRDSWTGTNRYTNELSFSMLRESKKIYLIWGTNDGDLVWQKGFQPVSWRLLAAQ